MTKTKPFTYCNDELIDDPLTLSYINDPRSEHILKEIHEHNHTYRSSSGKCGIRPSAHVRITPQSLNLAERLKKEHGLEVFPAQFRNRVHYSEGCSQWTMPIIEYLGRKGIGTVGSDWPVRDLITCKQPFMVIPIDGGDIEIDIGPEDAKRLHEKFVRKFNRRY